MNAEPTTWHSPVGLSEGGTLPRHSPAGLSEGGAERLFKRSIVSIASIFAELSAIMILSFDSLTVLEMLAFAGLLLGTGLYSLFNTHVDERSYFLAGCSVCWLMVGTSLFTVDFFFYAVFATPLISSVLGRIVVSTLLSVAVMLFAGWKIIPGMRSSGHTNPVAFYTGRIGNLNGALMTIVTLLVLVVFAASSLFYSMDVILKEKFGMGIKPLGLVLTALAGIFAVVGGYATVIRLHILTVCGIIGSALFLAIRGVNPFNFFMTSVNIPDETPLLSWIGYVAVICWIYVNNQMYLQHVFAANSDADMKKGVSVAVILKLIVAGVFVFVLVVATPISEVPVGRSETTAAVSVFLCSVFLSAVLGVMNSSAAIISASAFRKYFPTHTENASLLSGRLTTERHPENASLLSGRLTTTRHPENASLLSGRLTTTIIVLILMMMVFVTDSIDAGMVRIIRSMSMVLVSPIAAVSLASLVRRQEQVEGFGAATIGGILCGCALVLFRTTVNITSFNTISISDYGIAFSCFCISISILSSVTIWHECVEKLGQYRNGRE